MTFPPPPLPLPDRHTAAHKGHFGHVLLIGGSRGMAGAIALSSIAALKSGAGLVSTAVPDRCLETVASFHPAVMTLPLADTDDGQILDTTNAESFLRDADAIGCGPGMRTGSGAIRLVERLLMQTDQHRVLDADAINVLAEQRFLESPALPRVQDRLVITPHPGEFARLTGAPAKNRTAQIRAAVELAEATSLVIVLKGGPTVVVGKESASAPVECFENTTGNPGMATAGSGDVLTGVVTSLLGQGFSPLAAARLSVYLHGIAGDLAAQQGSQFGMTSMEIASQLPDAFRQAIIAGDKTT